MFCVLCVINDVNLSPIRCTNQSLSHSASSSKCHAIKSKVNQISLICRCTKLLTCCVSVYVFNVHGNLLRGDIDFMIVLKEKKQKNTFPQTSIPVTFNLYQDLI